MRTILSAFALLLFISASHSHAKDANGCPLFEKSFPGETAFTVQAWPQPDTGAGKRLLTDPVAGQKLELSGLEVKIEEGSAGKPAKLILLATMDEVEIPFSQKASFVGQTITLSKPLALGTSNLKGEQKEALLKSVEFADWLTAAEAKTGALYHVPLAGNGPNRNAVFDAALQRIVIDKGQKLEITAVKADSQPPEVTLTTAEDVELSAGDMSDLPFAFAFPVSLEMVPSELVTGSLQVIDEKRSIAGTSLSLALTLGGVDFSSTSFRGCIGFHDQRTGKQKKDHPSEADPLWLPIQNVEVDSATTGRAQVSFTIGDLPACLDNKFSCDKANLKDPYTPRMGKTLSELAFGGQENVIIEVAAANSATGILYRGSTSYFVDDRTAALLISLAAFALSYLVLVGLWAWNEREARTSLSRGQKVLATLNPLQLIRGHNGTASLSNLQILWWTLAVFSLMIYSWVATGGLAGLNQTIMWLLGIGGTGSLASKAVAINNKKNAAAMAAMREVRQNAQPDFWDLISVSGRLDLTKLQMVLFTVIAGIYVVTNVWEQVVFPELPTELLTLMGLSNGLYVLGKFTASNPYQEVGNLQQELEIAEAGNENLEARKKALETKIAKLTEVPEASRSETQKKDLSDLNEKLKNVKLDIETQNELIKILEDKITKAKEKLDATPD